MAVLAEVEREIYQGMEILEDAFEKLHERAENMQPAHGVLVHVIYDIDASNEIDNGRTEPVTVRADDKLPELLCGRR